MKKVVLVILYFSILASACHKKHDAAPAQATNNLLPLAVGNYWIYEDINAINNADTATDKTLNPKYPFDSLYISGDTSIRGNTYYVFKFVTVPKPINPQIAQSYPTTARDSSGFMVDANGHKWVSNTLGSTDTLYKIYPNQSIDVKGFCKMRSTDTSVTVPSGAFRCSDAEVVANLYTFNSTNSDSLVGTVYGHYFYANNVGMVKLSLPYVSGTGFFERTLVRYKVN